MVNAAFSHIISQFQVGVVTAVGMDVAPAVNLYLSLERHISSQPLPSLLTSL